jgi:hypothetical protein
MPYTWVTIERFQLLEEVGPMTPSEMAKRTGFQRKTVATWLSRMTDLERPDGTHAHYLTHIPPDVKSHRERGRHVRNEGTYKINPKYDWTEITKTATVM